jgi:hypothetical protein
MSLGWAGGRYIMVLELWFKHWSCMGQDGCKFVKFVVADFVCDRFGEKHIFQREIPNSVSEIRVVMTSDGLIELIEYNNEVADRNSTWNGQNSSFNGRL